MAQQTQEITRDEWHPFFDAFSGMHRGLPVTLEIHGGGPDEGEVRASSVPLEEIAAEIGPTEMGRISIVLRPTQDNEISHVIEAPQQVWLREESSEETGEEANLALEIVSAEGTTTLLRVRQGELPKPGPEFFA